MANLEKDEKERRERGGKVSPPTILFAREKRGKTHGYRCERYVREKKRRSSSLFGQGGWEGLCSHLSLRLKYIKRLFYL